MRHWQKSWKAQAALGAASFAIAAAAILMTSPARANVVSALDTTLLSRSAR